MKKWLKRLLLAVLALVGAVLVVGVVALLVPPRVAVESVPPGFTEKRFDTGEVTLSYVEGPANGPPMVLIPGQMESWHGYKLVMGPLARKHRVFVLDMRGHGGSTRTPGRYSYLACGDDVRLFLEQVVREPAIVSGLSSGGVIAAWVAANAPDHVRAAVLEDPPIYSSLWPRIREERYMSHMFQVAVDELGGPRGRNVEGYFRAMGVPQPDSDELLKIPPVAVDVLMRLKDLGQWLRPNRPYDVPLLPYSMRAGFKGMSEYDVDFSAATLDGRLSAGFDPDVTLRSIACPVLYLHANWSRHPTWGLLGAADDRDVERVKTLVKDLRVVRVDSPHAVHLSQPKQYLREVSAFLESLEQRRSAARD